MYWQTAEIRSKHGLIISCDFQLTDTLNDSIRETLTALGRSLEGKRYGVLGNNFVPQTDVGPGQEVGSWLQRMTGT